MWLTTGLVAGLCISYFWPHEPVAAASNDRDAKFGIMTTPVTLGMEGVFVLDYLTGRLSGAVMNGNTGKFNHTYIRSVAADFKVDPKATPHYAFVGGTASLAGRGGVSPATSIIYVGELSSGVVMAYGINYKIAQRPVPTQPFVPLDAFPFREASVKSAIAICGSIQNDKQRQPIGCRFFHGSTGSSPRALAATQSAAAVKPVNLAVPISAARWAENASRCISCICGSRC